PGAIVEFRTAHRLLEFLLRGNFAKERVGREQDLVVEENVVDAYDALLAQLDIIGLGRTLKHLEPQAEVRVVIKVRTRRDHPIDEAVFDKWNEAGHAEPGGR